MKKLIALTLAVLMSTPCLAAPKKSEAEKWLFEFRTAHDKKGDALFLNDPVKRRDHMRVLMKLRDRADKIFGQQSDCGLAANGLVEIWANEIELARGASNSYITASGLANMAWESGQSYGTCRDMIDAMK